MKVRLLILLSCCMLSILAYGQRKSLSTSQNKPILTIKETDSVIFQLALPPIDSIGMFAQTEVHLRLHKSKPNFILFPRGGTATNIIIVDSACASSWKTYSDCPAIKRLDFWGGRLAGLLDISDLKRGTYIVVYGACHIAGSYKLHVEFLPEMF